VDYSNHRWTVDTPEDLAFVQAVYDRFGNEDFSWREVLGMLDREPELMRLNRHIVQKDVEEC
jgi:spore coat polysaccharide biosynthesis protein SpsF